MLHFLLVSPARTVLQPNERRSRVRWIVLRNIGYGDSPFVARYVHVGVRVAERPVVERLCYIGVGVTLALFKGLKECGVCVFPVVDCLLFDLEEVAELSIG